MLCDITAVIQSTREHLKLRTIGHEPSLLVESRALELERGATQKFYVPLALVKRVVSSLTL